MTRCESNPLLVLLERVFTVSEHRLNSQHHDCLCTGNYSSTLRNSQRTVKAIAPQSQLGVTRAHVGRSVSRESYVDQSLFSLTAHVRGWQTCQGQAKIERREDEAEAVSKPRAKFLVGHRSGRRYTEVVCVAVDGSSFLTSDRRCAAGANSVDHWLIA